jgi:hypothetical protein
LQTIRLHLVADGEEQADQNSVPDRAGCELRELAPKRDAQGEHSERHANRIEDQWRCVTKRILDDDEGHTPHEGGEDEEQVRFDGTRHARRFLHEPSTRSDYLAS